MCVCVCVCVCVRACVRVCVLDLHAKNSLYMRNSFKVKGGLCHTHAIENELEGSLEVFSKNLHEKHDRLRHTIKQLRRYFCA